MQPHSHRPDSAPRVLTPSRQRADAPLVLRIVDAAPDRPMTVVSSSVDHRGLRWSALAVFRPHDTVIDVARDPAVAGSYRGVDPDGLLTRMAPEDGYRRVSRFVPADNNGFDVRLDVEADGRVVAGAVVKRVLLDTGVTVRAVDVGRGASARLFLPPAEGRRRVAVLAVGRRTSAVADIGPAALASRGYLSASLLLRASAHDTLRRGSGTMRLQRRLEAVHTELTRHLYGSHAGTLLLASGMRPGMAWELAAASAADVWAVAEPDAAGGFGVTLTAARDGEAHGAGTRRRIVDAEDGLGLGRMPGDRRVASPGQEPAARARADAWDALLDELRRLSVAWPAASSRAGEAPLPRATGASD